MRITTRTEINGRRFSVPIWGEIGTGNLEPSELWMLFLLEKLQHLIRNDGGMFVDVGINLGQTLLKLRSVLPEFKYVGFDPNPECIAYVNALVRLNGFENTTVYPIGLSDRAAVLQLQSYADDTTDSTASLIQDFRPEHKVLRRLNVPVFPMNSLNLEGTLRFVKIDVEGAELEVIRGMMDALSRDRPIVLMEILPAYDSDNTPRIARYRQVEHFFRELNYSCYRVRKTSRNAFESLQLLQSIEVHSDLTLSDYLWTPLSLSKEIEEAVRV
jgi:FkbM family methyltransferase